MKILVHYPFTDEQHDHLRQIAHDNGGHEVFVANDDQEALAVASEIDIIVGHFPPAVCAAAPNLRWIQSFSTGMDKFLFPAIIARDEVAISNVAGLYAPQGGEHAWALLLALTRGIDQSIRHNDQRKWAGGTTVELTGQTLGLVGLGGFGLEMAKRAAGYDMPIIAIDPVRRDLPPGVSELKDNSREKPAQPPPARRRGDDSLSTHRGDVPPHRARRTRADEGERLSDQCDAGRHHRRGRALPSPARRANRRCRYRRH